MNGSDGALLRRDGAVVVRVLADDDVGRHRDRIVSALLGAYEFRPEYLRKVREAWVNGDARTKDQVLGHNHLVLGAFGALSFPTAWHHPEVRHTRMVLFDALRRVACSTGWRRAGDEVQMLLDRVVLRYPREKVSKEGFHRDIADAKVLQSLGKCPSSVLLDDVILQSWLNLGETSTRFTFVPGTHLVRDAAVMNENMGFGAVDKDRAAAYGGQERELEIPPGHAVLFVQNIVHAVNARVLRRAMLRLHVGLRITRDKGPLWPDVRGHLRALWHVRLPSGQLPGLWSPCFNSFLKSCRERYVREAIRGGTEALIDEALDTVGAAGGGFLAEPQAVFPPYREGELAALGLTDC